MMSSRNRLFASSIVLSGLLVAVRASAAMLAVGDAMPEFALPDHESRVVRSSELAGKSYLLWFYPKAQTPGCTKEARGLRDEFKDFEAAGVTILGVSFDDPDANRKFVEAESLPFRLLSDKDRKLAVAVGAADSESASAARRISYLVGPDGKVRNVFGEVDPSTHASDVLAACGIATPPSEQKP
jgi:peroxiredoxin Q/BCP